MHGIAAIRGNMLRYFVQLEHITSLYMFGRTYVILYFDPRVFVLCGQPRPKLH